MNEMSKATVHASEVISARDTIQTPYSEFNVGANLPKVTEAELAKLAKRQEKEDKARRQALERHKVTLSSVTMLDSCWNLKLILVLAQRWGKWHAACIQACCKDL